MKKMSLNEMKSLSRNEMKKIMAGSGGDGACSSHGCAGSCTFNDGSGTGTCRQATNGSGKCYCASGS